jgi:hypothetical protein
LGALAPGAEGLAQEPSLPQGLEKKTRGKTPEGGPSLPSGLEGEDQGVQEQSEAPGLPPGLEDGKTSESKPEAQAADRGYLPPGITGFLELRGGLRIKDDPVQDDVTLAEARLQLSYDKSIASYIPRGRFRITNDFLYDAAIDDPDDVDLEEGKGMDLRDFWVSCTPLDFMDLKVGRQILTWGTGNLIFLNDLFPKDYQSFFLGRDLEYLKAPSDAVKTAFYSAILNLDIVYTPRFDPDRFVDGSRISFFDPALGRFRGEDSAISADPPDEWFTDDEIAARIHRNIRTYELAAYGYRGFWKGPAGVDPSTGSSIFPKLFAMGASIRGPAGPGIGNAEFSWYRSEEDTDGDNPYVDNSQLRFLVGYEQEIATDLTMGLQYYLEWMLDYDNYRDSLPQGFPARDEDRHWVTIDLTQELLAQNQLVLSLFTFYSLSSQDAYLRPNITYELTDNWRLEMGGNIFLGDRETFFGGFEENSNIYGAVRYGF